MRFVSKNIFFVVGILLLSSIASVLFWNETAGYALLVGGVLVCSVVLITAQQQTKKLATRFLNDDARRDGVIPAAAALLERQESQIKNMIAAVVKIKEGALDEATVDQLEGDAKNAIVSLQSNLQSMKEQEAKQTWIVKGIAQMSEIRKSNNSLEDYGYQITSTLVKYLEANQGAFYLLRQEEQVLELLATYAWGKRKFSDKKITVDLGNGLLGQSVVEKDLIFMTDVPADYVKITSGLGAATPRCITITPLIFRDQVYGVVEIASFQIFEKHHLEFVEEISESVASELADIIRQDHTAKLLQQSQLQGQELKSQEEELRQNMEEMQATQEEMKRKEKTLLQHMTDLNKAQDQMRLQEGELKQQLKQVLSERKKNQAILEGCVDGVVSFAENGKIQFCNRAAEEIFGQKKRKILFQNVELLLDIKFGTGNQLTTLDGTPIGIRTEVSATNGAGEKISVLLTSTTYDAGEEGKLFTLFIQKISVDLF
jgi:PAS domain S-box-containing protein